MNKAPDHSEREHSIMGTSRAPIYMECTGYFSAIEGLPPEEKSDASAAGDKFHETMEVVMHDFLEHKLYGSDAERSYERLKEDPEIDSEMWDHIEEAKKAVWEMGFEKSVTGKAYGLEEPFYLAEFEVNKKKKIKIGGAIDLWIVYRDKKGLKYGVVIDYKYGYKVVSEKSKQLWCSATAMYQEFKELGKELDVVRAIIYQPRTQGASWKEVKYSAQQLVLKRNKFLQIADDVFVKGKVKFKAGDHCEWCPARGECKVRADYIQAQSGLSVIREKAALPKPEMLSTDQIEKVLTYKDDITNFLKACYSLALRKQMKKPFLKSFKLVEGISKRKFKKESSIVARALKEHGVKKPFRPPVDELITIGDAEKALKKAGKNNEEVKNILSHLTERGQAQKILVPLDDERTALPSYKDLLTHKEKDDE